MNLNRDSDAFGILHFEPRSPNEAVLGTDEGMKKMACFNHFLVPFIVSLGDIEPGPDVFKVWRKDDDLHSSFLSRLFDPSADPFA